MKCLTLRLKNYIYKHLMIKGLGFSLRFTLESVKRQRLTKWVPVFQLTVLFMKLCVISLNTTNCVQDC